MRNLIRSVAAGLVATLIAACGFQLRGDHELPFKTLYLAVPQESELGINLKRILRTKGTTKVVDRREDAEAVFTPVLDSREKTILSLSGTGRVREYQLRYRYAFRVTDPKGHDLMAPANLYLTRDLTFNDSNVLGKEQEDALLWRDMEQDLLQQVMRRLSAAKPPAAPAAE